MAEPGRTEQIISQFLLKTLHAVLGARVPHLHRARPPDQASRARRRDRWFNLALGDLPAALESPGFWHPGVMDPMIIDIILFPREGADQEAVVERWTAQCESPPPWSAAPHSTSGGEGSPSSSSSSSSPSAFYRKTYKKSIVLLRSLYSFLRLLPAYRVFRMLCSSNQSYNYDISYRVSSFAEPFSREEEAEFKPHSFSAVETQFGQISLSVSYRPSLSNFNFEVSSLMPPMIITDYVGSPAADPLRAFPSSPADKGIRSTSFPLRAIRSSAPPSLARPHSWTSAPLAHNPLSSSPTKASDLRSSPMDVSGHRGPSQLLSAHRKGSSFSFDEFRLSPPFSTSPTPSPPAHTSNPLYSRLRSETAPVSIPQGVMGTSQAHRSPNLSDPTRIFLPPPSPRSTRADPSQESPSGSRSFRKLEGFKVGDFYSNLHWYTSQKGVLKDGRDDSGRFSGALSSGGSPRFGISRSSSRLSIQDDLDDCDFSCPFAVDDVDTSYSQTRNSDGKHVSTSAPASASSHKSQDAAVGILVHMLRTAPPLRQDPSNSSQSSKSGLNEEVGTSSFFMPRKTSDALEELRSYGEMKEILLSQSGTQLRDSVKRTK